MGDALTYTYVLKILYLSAYIHIHLHSPQL